MQREPQPNQAIHRELSRSGFHCLGRLAKVALVMALWGWLMAANTGLCTDNPSFTESQVKALFLLNFTKYVEWPADDSVAAGTPFTIGVMGESKIGNDLAKAVVGKTVNGRPIVIETVARDADGSNCQVLFITSSEKNRLAEILNKLKTKPVLTVGETDQFLEQGGIINFTKKEGKVRLEIDLRAAQQAKVKISSKLLGVADVVRGKSN